MKCTRGEEKVTRRGEGEEKKRRSGGGMEKRRGGDEEGRSDAPVDVLQSSLHSHCPPP